MFKMRSDALEQVNTLTLGPVPPKGLILMSSATILSFLSTRKSPAHTCSRFPQEHKKSFLKRGGQAAAVALRRILRHRVVAAEHMPPAHSSSVLQTRWVKPRFHTRLALAAQEDYPRKREATAR